MQVPNWLLIYTRTKVFQKLGRFPTGITAAGDLIFYKNELYMAALPNILVKIDLTDLSKSVKYMTLSNNAVYGLANVALDCTTNRVFAFGVNGGKTDVIELDIDNKVELGVKCSLPFSVGDAASLTENGSLLGVNINSINIKNVCSNVGKDGTITINATGGSNNLTYMLNATTINTTGNFTNLPEGNYPLNITTKEGCGLDTVLTIKKVEPPIIQSIEQFITCDGFNASLLVNASSPTSPALWYTINAGLEQTTNVFNNIGSGTYNIQVRDQDLCLSNKSATVFVGSRAAFFNRINVAPTFCGNPVGSINVQLSAAYPNATISVNNGVPQTSGLFQNMANGSYLLSVFYGTSCRFDTTILIMDSASAKPIITIATISPSCHNINNGKVDLGISGTNMPYNI